MNAAMLTVFDVQRFSLHDGPGLRTTVFLKGCPLRCRWCQNPESLAPSPEVAFYAERCAGCGACARACPLDALDDGPDRLDRERCDACGRCAEACPHEALRLVGRHVAPEDLLAEVLADRDYFEATDGGLTLSGGEPLLQAQAVAPFLSSCKEAGLDVTVETCGAVPWRAFEAVLPHVDRFFFDLKATGAERHRELCGQPDERIRDNAARLVEAGAEVVFRMPVVPGHNDALEVVDGIATRLAELDASAIRLLPYHRGGESKIPRVGSEQPVLGLDGAAEALARVGQRLEERGVAVSTEQVAARGEARHRDLFPDRVWRLRDEVQQATPGVCMERARLVTDFFRRHADRSEPMVVRKARALHHLFSHRQARIRDGELLVGCFTSRRVGGSVFPELHGVTLLEDLVGLERRAVNPLQIDPRDARDFALRIMPYWLPRFMSLRAHPMPRALGFVAEQLAGRAALINESGGISHLVPDLETLLSEGTEGIAARARELAEHTEDTQQLAFYQAVQIAAEALASLAEPYAVEARRLAAAEVDATRRVELERIAAVCERVPRHPARTLHEAIQAVLFAQIGLNLESLDNSMCPGRLDQVLLPYYQADRDAGLPDDSRDLVGCFTVKMCEIVPAFAQRITRLLGGLFNGQVVVVGGVDRAGRDATNPLSWVFLDAMDALRMRQPNYHARVHAGSPAPFVERVSSMLADGSVAPSLMNDEVVIPMLRGRGTALEDARDYSPVGCVEPVAAGASFTSTDAALINLALPLERALGLARGGAPTRPITEATDLEQVIDLLVAQIDHQVDRVLDDLQAVERANARLHPTPLTSMLIRGCVESGVDSTAGGARYNGSGVQGVGVVDLGDSLAAIDQVVFQRRLCTMATLISALRRDFDGHEDLRGHLLKAPKYGNDDPRVDQLVARVMAAFSASLSRHTNTRGGPYWAGWYSVTAHEHWGRITGALPSGRHAGRPLANGISPSNGLDRLGPTAALSSAASLDLVDHAQNGVNVNLKLDGAGADPSAITGLIRGYFASGGMQFQINAVDPQVLIEARDDPEAHPWLLVRVSGYSSYFADLSPEMKQEIIDRTLHGTCPS